MARVAVALVVLCTPAAAQMPMDMRMPDERVLGIPESRAGSGTSWLPDAAPMHAVHYRAGQWSLMLHGAAFALYDDQGGPRGANRVAATDWGMLAASRNLGGGRVELRTMLSTEPWTVGSRGYPLLLQSGESYGGAPLHDRQHPHDLFVELAAVYDRPVAQNLAVSIYLAPVGEPALGPVAFPHRPSAAADPFAPLGHHWQDATHITYGVITAGLFTRSLKLEASWFNGREPDENRTDFDYAGRRLDSYAGRLTVNPSAHWSLATWYGYLASPEALVPAEAVHRYGASALFSRALGATGGWSTALIFGANAIVGASETLPSVLIETTLDPDGRNSLFGRIEYVRKRAEDLAVPGVPAGVAYDVGAVSVGYGRQIARMNGGVVGLGARGAVSFVPPSLEALYGSRAPVGGAVYLRLTLSR
ncbi:MAG TPA: hypothetical protein VGV12_12255 [Gemmatimonadales bacterium]|nr:hypothetical protein [Gemmatimonadales bacterium]